MNRLPLLLILAANSCVFLGCGSSQERIESPPSPPLAATTDALKADPPPLADAKPVDTGEYLADPSPNPPPSTAEFALTDMGLVLPGSITFERGSARIRKESLPALEHIAAYLTAKSYITLMRIEGHVDEVENESENQRISDARALAVSRWLVKRGIDCSRVLPVGFGWLKPVANRKDPEVAGKNTRIMAVGAEMRGLPIGGMAIGGGGHPAGDPCK